LRCLPLVVSTGSVVLAQQGGRRAEAGENVGWVHRSSSQPQGIFAPVTPLPTGVAGGANGGGRGVLDAAALAAVPLDRNSFPGVF
jgi:hypothetical protein